MPEKIKRYTERSRVFIKSKFTDDGAGWLFLQQILIAPISILTTVFLAKVLSIEDYGYYKYILSMYSIISLFSFLGIYNITTMNIQRGEYGFFSLGFKYKKILRWIPSIISFSIALYYFYMGNSFLAYFFLINIFSYLIVDTYDFYLVALQGGGNFKANAILGVSYYFFSFIPPVIAAYTTHNLYIVFITMYVFQAIFRLCSFMYIKNRLPFNDGGGYRNIKDLKVKEWKRESFELSINGALGSAGNNISGILVFNRLGAADNAIYALALTFADFVGGIITSTLTKTQLLLSKITKDNGYTKESDDLKIVYIKSLFKKYFLFSFLAMMLCMIILPFVYKFLFAKYLFSYKYAVIYSLFLLSISLSPAYYFFLEKRKLKIINTIQVFTLILNIVLVFISTMYFGLWGAIMVTILMKYVSNLVYTINMNYSNRLSSELP